MSSIGTVRGQQDSSDLFRFVDSDDSTAAGLTAMKAVPNVNDSKTSPNSSSKAGHEVPIIHR